MDYSGFWQFDQVLARSDLVNGMAGSFADFSAVIIDFWLLMSHQLISFVITLSCCCLLNHDDFL